MRYTATLPAPDGITGVGNTPYAAADALADEITDIEGILYVPAFDCRTVGEGYLLCRFMPSRGYHITIQEG